jgi:lysophospholipase L1-like esterase
MQQPNHTRREFLSLAAAAGAVSASACSDVPQAGATGLHVVLLGDSIFDNAVYVPGKPGVSEQLAAALAERGGRATLLARDGDRTADVADQLDGVPDGATHLVLSVGGNDALNHTALLDREIENSSELLAELAGIHSGFRAAYAAMLAAVLGKRLPTTVCTIYDSNFEAPRKELADVALSIWNDAILRCAGDAGVPVIDLRRIFRQPQDYANPIEPSVIGGAKLVAAMLGVVAAHDFASRRTTLYP